MSQQELLIRAAEAFDSLGVPYLVTGSIASSFHGEPRATHDADVVLAITSEAVSRLKVYFPEPQHYFDIGAAREAVARRGMFNILSVDTGDKIDCWLLTDSEFDRSRLARRRQEMMFGRLVSVQTAEDTIISKLMWTRETGGSEKQIGDVRAIMSCRSDSLDFGYIERWVASLRLREEWRRCSD